MEWLQADVLCWLEHDSKEPQINKQTNDQLTYGDVLWCDVRRGLWRNLSLKKMNFLPASTQTNSLLSYPRHLQCSSWSRRSPRPADCPAGKTILILILILMLGWGAPRRVLKNRLVRNPCRARWIFILTNAPEAAGKSCSLKWVSKCPEQYDRPFAHWLVARKILTNQVITLWKSHTHLAHGMW